MNKIFYVFILLVLSLNINVYAADCARTTGPFADEDILYADDYESEMNNLISCVNERIQGSNNTFSSSVIASGGDVKVYSGYNLKLYSDTGTTLFADIDGATGKIIGAPTNIGTYNISLKRGQTSVAGDSVEIECGDATCSATNPGYIVLNGSTAGQIALFKITSDILINLTGATWGAGGTGDLTARILRVLFVNDNGTLKTCVALVGGRTTILTTDSSATQANINLSEEVLCNSAIGSATNTAYEAGYVVSDFDDTGGSSEDLNTIQSGVNDVVTGISPDGIWQPWNPTFSGFSSNPTITSARWTQVGRVIMLNFIRNGSGTSNATSFAMTGPVDSRVVSKAVFGNHVDGGSAQTAAGFVKTDLGSDLLTLYKNASESSTWTNSSTKGADFSIIYEAGPAASFVN